MGKDKDKPQWRKDLKKEREDMAEKALKRQEAADIREAEEKKNAKRD